PSGTLRTRFDPDFWVRGTSGEVLAAPLGSGKASVRSTNWANGGTRVIMNRRRLASLMAASALLIGMFGLSAGGSVVLATGANTQYWLGNGTTDGEINNNDCATDSSAHQLSIWTGPGSHGHTSGAAARVNEG